MKIENINLFPILVYNVKNFITKKQCDDIIEYCKKNEELEPHELVSAGLSSFRYNDIKFKNKQNHLLIDIQENVYECGEIIKNIKYVVDEYSRQYGIITKSKNTLKFISWINIQTLDSILTDHIHIDTLGPCTIVGGLYLKTDPLSNGIFFHNPNPYINLYKENGNYNEYNSLWYKMKPEIGDLILFPSWLRHGSNNEKNLSEERIVLSFNVR